MVLQETFSTSLRIDLAEAISSHVIRDIDSAFDECGVGSTMMITSPGGPNIDWNEDEHLAWQH